MDAVLLWLQTNWVQLLTILLVVDQVLIGIFPSIAIFGSIKDIINRLIGSAPPKSLK